MELTELQCQDLSYILNRAAHKYAGDEAGAGDKDKMYRDCSQWSRIFEKASKGNAYNLIERGEGSHE